MSSLCFCLRRPNFCIFCSRLSFQFSLHYYEEDKWYSATFWSLVIMMWKSCNVSSLEEDKNSNSIRITIRAWEEKKSDAGIQICKPNKPYFLKVTQSMMMQECLTNLMSDLKKTQVTTYSIHFVSQIGWKSKKSFFFLSNWLLTWELQLT